MDGNNRYEPWPQEIRVCEEGAMLSLSFDNGEKLSGGLPGTIDPCGMRDTTATRLGGTGAQRCACTRLYRHRVAACWRRAMSKRDPHGRRGDKDKSA